MQYIYTLRYTLETLVGSKNIKYQGLFLRCRIKLEITSGGLVHFLI